MEKVKEFQGILLRYYKFGNNEDDCKIKVKKFATDMEFLGIPIRENIDGIMNNPNAYSILIQFSDMNFISTIRDNIDSIKNRHLEYKDSHKVEKSEFIAQYIEYLKTIFHSEAKARDVLKKLGSDMTALGCPIGDNLTGYVMESPKMHKLMTLSNMAVISKILEQVEIIKKG